MDKLIYTALSAMRGAMAQQTTTANNLANASTLGFRAELSSVRPTWLRGGGLESRAPSSEEVSNADMQPGPISQTGRDLDVALNGDALLAVQAENGDEAYTRRGDLSVAASGALQNGDGALVIGNGGPITLPPYDSVRIDKDGSLWIVPKGGDPKSPQLIDRMKLVSAAGSKITKNEDGLFRVTGGGSLPADPEAQLIPKAIEGSNVQVSKALVDMIEASRAWETQAKMLSSAKEMDTQAADLMRLPD